MKVVKTAGKVMVPRAGVEPARPFGQRILSPQRLPFRHPGMSSVTLNIPRMSVSLKQTSIEQTDSDDPLLNYFICTIQRNANKALIRR